MHQCSVLHLIASEHLRIIELVVRKFEPYTVFTKGKYLFPVLL